MSRTMTASVFLNSWYISLPSTVKHRCEIIEFWVVWRTLTTTVNYLNFYLKFITVSQIKFWHSFDSDKQRKLVP